MVNYVYNQPNLTGGIDDALIDVATAVPAFPIGLLIFVYITVLFGGTSTQKNKTGYADWAMWNLFASLSTFLLSLIMTMRTGLINVITLGIVVAITLLSGLWYFMSGGRNEAE